MKRVLQSKSVENHSSPYGSVQTWRTGKRHAGRFEGGAVLPLVVASMFALAFMAGLAIDAGRAYTSRDEVQAAADAAALAGSQARQKGVLVPDAKGVAHDVAVAHGYADDEIKVYIPPEVGSHAADDKFVRVVISRKHATFIDYGGVDSLNPVGTATAGGGPSAPIDRCLTILSTDSDSISLGNADILNPKSNCGIRTMGGIEANKNNAKISDFRAITACGPGPSKGVVTEQTQASYDLKEDTYCSPEIVAMPDFDIKKSPCGTYPNGSKGKLVVDNKFKGNKVINPGVYCNGIEIKKETLSLNPGVYVIYGGGLTLDGNSTITCPSPCKGGVVIRNDGGKDYPYGAIDFKSGPTVSLSPRKSDDPNDPYNGFLIVQPMQNKSTMVIDSITTGNSDPLGNLFLPGATLDIKTKKDKSLRLSSITADKLDVHPAQISTIEFDSELLQTDEEMKYPTPVLHE